jgi:hypothetical protein
MKNKQHTTQPLNKAIKVALITSLISFSASSMAAPLIDGLGGESGFGELALAPNDDDSSNLLNLNFTANFFGNTYTQFYINNNGNITFQDPVGGYTPEPFPASSNPMIAPYWADVDTSTLIDVPSENNGISNNVYVAAPNEDTAIITWNDVGYYDTHTDLTNNFQLILRDRSDDTGSIGDFDIEFRYDRLEWTTGDASDGLGGFGGTPAQAGFDAGDNTNAFTLPGSFTNEVLELQNQTNVSGGENGLWVFAIREGSVPGETSENPILPVIVDDSYTFEFDVELNETVFIDPEVAIGYDYAITSNTSPLIASVILPAGFGDDEYELWLWNGTEFEFSTDLNAGFEFDFTAATPAGVDRFRILGIESGLNVDPTDPLAFVTGLTFASPGTVSMSQTPIVFNTDPASSVPEPAPFALILVGLTAIFWRRRKAK